MVPKEASATDGDGGAEALWQRSEARWREAHAITTAHPHLDPGDVYHALKVLPLERVVVSKRAANRLKDRAQIPMLEAALAARRARDGQSA